MGKSTDPAKARTPKLVKLAEQIGVYDAICRPGQYERADVSNRSDDDQRAMVRSRGYTKDKHEGRSTLKRRSRLGTAPMAKLLSQRELAACEWYAAAYSARYETLGITANYAAIGGGGGGNFDHLPKTAEQEQALQYFEYARAGISPSHIGLFEDVVLRCGLVGRRALAFKVAVLQLMARIEGKVEL